MNTYENVYHQFEKGFLGSCALGILVQSCVGGIAAMLILELGNGFLQMIQLFLVVAACITFNGSILSMQKPRTVFNIFGVSMVLCIGLALASFARMYFLHS